MATAADGAAFNDAAEDYVDGLTRTMVLHPIACAVAFLAALFSAGPGVVGLMLGAFVGGGVCGVGGYGGGDGG